MSFPSPLFPVWTGESETCWWNEQSLRWSQVQFSVVDSRWPMPVPCPSQPLCAGHCCRTPAALVVWEQLAQDTSAQERNPVLSHSVKNGSTGYIWKVYILPCPCFKVVNFPFLSCCLLDIWMAGGEVPLLTPCRDRQCCHSLSPAVQNTQTAIRARNWLFD